MSNRLILPGVFPTDAEQTAPIDMKPFIQGPARDNTVGHAAATLGSVATPADESTSEVGTLEGAAAFWRHETVIGQFFADYAGVAQYGDSAEREPGYNPYRHWQDTKDANADLEPYIRQGLFDHTYSQAQFERLAAGVRKEQEDVRLMGETGALGTTIGMGLSLLDVTTLLPYSAPLKGYGIVKNGLRLAGMGAAQQGVQEMMLHQQQALRTKEESFVNIGVAGVLGGGIGALASVRHPASPANPLRGSPALSADTPHPTAVMNGHGEIEVIGQSAGAAAARDIDTRAVGGDSLLYRMAKPILGVSPVGRSTQWVGEKTRGITQRLYDLGGIITKHNEDGIAQIAAEDRKYLYMAPREELTVIGRESWQDMAMELGKVDSRLAATAKGDLSMVSGGRLGDTGLTKPQFDEIVQRKLTSKTWAEGRDWTSEAVDSKWFDDQLADAGLSTEQRAVVEKHTDKVAKEWQKRVESRADELEKRGFITKEQRLGTEYGLPQLWNRDNVNFEKDDFRAFLIDVFSKRPTSDWLDEAHGLKMADFEALPLNDVKRQEIMADWLGDSERLAVQKAEHALWAANDKLSEATSQFHLIRAGVKEAKRLHKKPSQAEALEMYKARGLELDAKRVKLEADEGIPPRDVAEAEALRSRREALDMELRTHEEYSTRIYAAKTARELAARQLREVRAGLKLAEKEMKQAKTATNAAQRAYNRADKSNILSVIDDIVDALGDHQKAPFGLLESTVGTSGRFKDRTIHLSVEQRRMAAERGWLHNDLEYLGDRLYDDTSARMALHDTFGQQDMKPLLKEIDEEYRQLAQGKEPKQYAKLMAERDKAKKDVEMGVNRLLGRAEPPRDPESFAMWGLDKLRQATFLRFVAGFPIASLTDVATTVFQTGFSGLSLKHAAHVTKLLRSEGIDPASRELRAMLAGAEMSMAHSTASRQYLLNEAKETMGVGARGSALHGITRSIDVVMNTAASRASAWSMMTSWNAVLKGMAGLAQVDTLSKTLGKYDSLPVGKKAELASIGLGETEAKRVQKMFEQHGTTSNGEFSANAHLWTDRQAYADLRIALKRTMNRAVMTPGYGDVPLMMSSALGKVVLQFQSYGFATVNRVLMPALQRGLVHGDIKALEGAITLFGAATMVTAIKGYINGRDPSQYTAGTWAKEVVDRSGVTAYLSPYIDGAMKAAGVQTGLSTRYSRNTNWWESFLGPWWSTVKTTGQTVNEGVAFAHGQGDAERLREKALLLAPFNQWFRLGRAIVSGPDEDEK